MKKKLIAVCLIIAMMAITVVGGTMAYFFDTDEATNTFTVGNVTIDLEEKQYNEETDEYTPYPEDPQPLMPGTADKNNVSKIAWVTNTSTTNDAWVWADVLIPADLDVKSNASSNSLHFNYYGHFESSYFAGNAYIETAVKDGFIDYNNAVQDGAGTALETAGVDMVDSVADYLWTLEGPLDETVKLTRDVNGVETEVEYNVYRFKMENQLPAGKTSLPFLRQVYMDMGVTQCLGSDCGDEACQGYILKDGSHYADGMPWDLVVRGYAMQNEGFTTVDEAIAAYEEAQK